MANQLDSIKAHIQEVEKLAAKHCNSDVGILVTVATRDSLESQYFELFKLCKELLEHEAEGR